MIFVVLPAYNERVALSQLLPEISQTLRTLRFPFQTIVIDDGSTDGSQTVLVQMFENHQVKSLTHSQNRGYGAALQTGLQWCFQNGQKDDIVVTMDADLSHPATMIPELVQKIQSGFDVVTASPQRGKILGVPYHRRILTFCSNTLFHLVLRLPNVTSYTSGFRAYRWEILAKASERFGGLAQTTGFSASMEVFLKVAAVDAKIAEVPLTLRYDLKPGKSKMKIIQTIGLYLKLLWKARQWQSEKWYN